MKKFIDFLENYSFNNKISSFVKDPNNITDEEILNILNSSYHLPRSKSKNDLRDVIWNDVVETLDNAYSGSDIGHVKKDNPVWRDVGVQNIIIDEYIEQLKYVIKNIISNKTIVNDYRQLSNLLLKINTSSIESTLYEKYPPRQDEMIEKAPNMYKALIHLDPEIKKKYSHIDMGDKFGVFDDE